MNNLDIGYLNHYSVSPMSRVRRNATPEEGNLPGSDCSRLIYQPFSVDDKEKFAWLVLLCGPGDVRPVSDLKPLSMAFVVIILCALN
jgi:hypothetical protein